MAIDLHAHYIPPALAARLRERRAFPFIERLAGGTERLHMPVGTLELNALYFEIERRIPLMDEWGVERQLLSLPGLFGIDSLPLDDAAPLVRLFNEDVADVCRRHPDRFAGLAALPIANADAAIAELRRTRREGGLTGAIVPIDSFVTLEHANAMRPLFEAADDLGAHFFLHPGKRPDGRTDLQSAGPSPTAARDHELARRALDVQTEVASATITLLLSDYLDAYPRVSVQVANLGGTFAAVVERMDHTVRTRTPDAVMPSSRTNRIHVDCASLGPRTLELAVAVFGADRVVLGTDCPIFRTDWTLETVRQARIGEDERRLILSANARRLLQRVS